MTALGGPKCHNQQLQLHSGASMILQVHIIKSAENTFIGCGQGEQEKETITSASRN